MSILDKKISEFEKDEEGNIDVPLDDDVTEAINEMVKQFDSSESGDAIKEIDIKFFSIDKSGCAGIYMHIKGVQSTYTHYSYGSRDSPPDIEVTEERIDEGVDLMADGVTDDMTIDEVITLIGSQCYDDKEFVREMRELTQDINGDETDE